MINMILVTTVLYKSKTKILIKIKLRILKWETILTLLNSTIQFYKRESFMFKMSNNTL